MELSEDQGWHAEGSENPVIERFVHRPSGAVAQVLVVHGSASPPDHGEAALAIIADWDARFRLDDPRVQTRVQGTRTMGGIDGTFAELGFADRAGWYFGLPARSISTSDDEDPKQIPRAFFVLCEGPADEGAAPEPCDQVPESLRIRD